MSAFDKIIGYQSVKDELIQLCDMIHHREIYEQMGATLPKGLLLYGEPGLGKTLMAKCLMEESGLNAIVVRRNRSDEYFLKSVFEAFAQAKKQAPSIVLLDDLDKIGNEDAEFPGASEYAVVQSEMDDASACGVFVIATANNLERLPESLLRAGRFDCKIEILVPNEADSAAIVRHYLSGKRISDDVCFEDLTKMIQYSSCAELESILNKAAISAAFARKKSIEMEDLVGAVLREEYNAPDAYTEVSEEERRKTALHEAGHLVACEALRAGSVGLASLRTSGRDSMGGFVSRCEELPRRPQQILVLLAGKAAVELYYSETCASGCQTDIERAWNLIRDGITESGTRGFGMVDISRKYRDMHTSESLNARGESVVQAELERYFYQAKDIMLKNRAFLEAVATELAEKETLLFSDIQRIRSAVPVTEVTA